MLDGVSTTIFGGGGALEAVERRAAQTRDAIGRALSTPFRGIAGAAGCVGAGTQALVIRRKP